MQHVFSPMLNVGGVKCKESDRYCVGRLGTGVTNINVGGHSIRVWVPACRLASDIPCLALIAQRGGSKRRKLAII